MSIQESLDLSIESASEASSKTIIPEGNWCWVGEYQVRNFNGYHQSRHGASGPWLFCISSFDATVSGQAGNCNVLMADGSLKSVPIDEQDRISILGEKYGRDRWIH